MEQALLILMTLAMNRFKSSEAGSKMMNGISSAKTASSLWQKFQPQQ